MWERIGNRYGGEYELMVLNRYIYVDMMYKPEQFNAIIVVIIFIYFKLKS